VCKLVVTIWRIDILRATGKCLVVIFTTRYDKEVRSKAVLVSMSL
jgi:non-homologous end joining protein Ku